MTTIETTTTTGRGRKTGYRKPLPAWRYPYLAGELVIIPLSHQGKHYANAFADASDWTKVKDIGWRVGTGTNRPLISKRGEPTFYAVYSLVVDGIQRLVYLHNAIVGHRPWDDPSQQVDHINRNTLDNRNCNLRLGPEAHNRITKRRCCDGSMEYRCVTQAAHSYKMFVRVAGTYYGCFETKEDAARVADIVFYLRHGSLFNDWNFPGQDPMKPLQQLLKQYPNLKGYLERSFPEIIAGMEAPEPASQLPVMEQMEVTALAGFPWGGIGTVAGAHAN